MQEQLNTLIEKIKADYVYWHQVCNQRRDETAARISNEMVAEFNDSIEVLPGKKYVKIVCKRSVWGFVVNVDNDKQFRKGDILKPAGWAAPARNFARGNVFEVLHRVNWTGA